MAPYLILDGYNLIGALERYADAGGFETARELLINDALKAAGWTGRDVVLVFDAHRGPGPERTESRAGGAMRIVYSGAGESADDVIERIVGSVEEPCTVYTADFALQRAVLAHGSIRATPREFEDLLDELPTLVRTPRKPLRSRIHDRLPPETLRELENVRRRAAREPKNGPERS